MGNWAQRTLRQMAEKDATDADRDKIASQRRSQVNSEAPYIWDQIRGVINEEVSDLNQSRPNCLRLEPHPLVPNPTLRVASSTKAVRLNFNPTVPLISLEVSHSPRDVYTASAAPSSEHIEFDADARGVWLRVRGGDGAPMSIHETAAFLLDKLKPLPSD